VATTKAITYHDDIGYDNLLFFSLIIIDASSYFGTWEAYSFRGNDPRWDYDRSSRSRATYLKNGNLNAGEDDWMNGFVEHHGSLTAFEGCRNSI